MSPPDFADCVETIVIDAITVCELLESKLAVKVLRDVAMRLGLDEVLYLQEKSSVSGVSRRGHCQLLKILTILRVL